MHACGRVLPHEVVMVEAVPLGWVVHVASVWRDEGVGSVWRHEQIWNHKMLQKSTPYFSGVRHSLDATDLGSW